MRFLGICSRWESFSNLYKVLILWRVVHIPSYYFQTHRGWVRVPKLEGFFWGAPRFYWPWQARGPHMILKAVSFQTYGKIGTGSKVPDTPPSPIRASRKVPGWNGYDLSVTWGERQAPNVPRFSKCLMRFMSISVFGPPISQLPPGKGVPFWHLQIHGRFSRFQICPLCIFGNKATDGTYIWI